MGKSKLPQQYQFRVLITLDSLPERQSLCHKKMLSKGFLETSLQSTEKEKKYFIVLDVSEIIPRMLFNILRSFFLSPTTCRHKLGSCNYFLVASSRLRCHFETSTSLPESSTCVAENLSLKT